MKLILLALVVFGGLTAGASPSKSQTGCVYPERDRAICYEGIGFFDLLSTSS